MMLWMARIACTCLHSMAKLVAQVQGAEHDCVSREPVPLAELAELAERILKLLRFASSCCSMCLCSSGNGWERTL